MNNVESKRITAITIDIVVISIVQVVFGLLLFLLSNDVIELFVSPLLGMIMVTIPIVGLIFKDHIFQNQSIGKKIVGLHVVNSYNFEKPSKSTLVTRNLFLLFIAFIAIVYLYNGKRIGDEYTNTIVTKK